MPTQNLPQQPTQSGTPPVILTAGGPLSWIVVNGLARTLGPLIVIQEQPETKYEIIRRRIRLLGWFRVMGQVAFGLCERILLRAPSRLKKICSRWGLDPRPNPAITVHRVPSVNAPECHELLAKLKPAVVGVYGTRILKSKTLQAINAPFINYHAGINTK